MRYIADIIFEVYADSEEEAREKVFKYRLEIPGAFAHEVKSIEAIKEENNVIS